MLIRTRLRQVVAFIGVLLMVGFLWGCLTHRLAGGWKSDDIIANGIDAEWPGEPLFVDEDLQLAVRVVNDNHSLALCIQTCGETLKRQLRMDGLTVWFDPKGGQEKIFGIHVPGGSPAGPGRRPSPEAGAKPPTDRDHRSGSTQPRAVPIEALQRVAITYGDATGPLTMEMNEVRRTGIAIGVGQRPDQSLVYEFSIAFKAAPSLNELMPGMAVGIGIQRGAAETGDRQPSSR